jgi:hypothetical protein
VLLDSSAPWVGADTAIGCCLGADDIMAGISLQRLRAIVLDSLGK